VFQRPANRSTAELLAALLEGSHPAVSDHVDLGALDQLPPPVARYFRHVFPDQERQGMLIPTEGEVGWYSRGEWECVWRGRAVEVDYESPDS
jgi:hypothetical protein